MATTAPILDPLNPPPSYTPHLPLPSVQEVTTPILESLNVTNVTAEVITNGSELLSAILSDSSFATDADVADEYVNTSVAIADTARVVVESIAKGISNLLVQSDEDGSSEEGSGSGEQITDQKREVITPNLNLTVHRRDAAVLENEPLQETVNSTGLQDAQVYIPAGWLETATTSSGRRLSEGSRAVETVMWVSDRDLHGLGSRAGVAGPTVSFTLSIDGEKVSELGEPVLLALPIMDEATAQNGCKGTPTSQQLFEQADASGATCSENLVCHTWDATNSEWTTDGCTTVTLNETTAAVGCQCTKVSTDYLTLRLPVANALEFGTLDGANRTCTSCQCTQGIDVILQKSQTALEMRTLEVALAENILGESLLSNWKFDGVAFDAAAAVGVRAAAEANETDFVAVVDAFEGDRAAQIVLQMLPNRLAESAVGYDADVQLTISDSDGGNAKPVNISVSVAVVAATVAGQTVWGEVSEGETCAMAELQGDGNGQVNLAFGELVSIAFTACDWQACEPE